MGTVGLSFGSPTSGTGFNVSQTVSQIVANLQNVETPWKNQLTKLQAQDTAISSLGTLFSNLSNDVSALTDLQGTMAIKTGSSSDTNVLSLSAATASAIAGTHTVEVGNLAATSSGFLPAVPNASTTLTGSITLQVGANGTPQTITLNSSDNTLAGLAAAINSSSVGVKASVLTDASGSRLSLVSGTSGASGNLIVSNNSLGQVLGYTGSPASGSANSTGSLAPIANLSDTLAGSFTIQVGSGTAQTIALDPTDNSLTGLQNTINNGSYGVTASIATNSQGKPVLSLVSNTSGSAGNLSITSNLVDTTTSALGYTSAVTGIDANLTVDGIALTSSSNTVSNLIPGVTFNLLAPSTTGEQVQVVIGNDNAGVESAISQMVSDYNSLVSAVNAQEGLDSSNNAEPLFGSPTLSLLQQQILAGLNKQNPNGYLTPVSSTNTTLSGTLSIQVAGGITQNFTTSSTNNTLATMAAAVNAANIGVTASVVTNSGNTQSLSFLSQTAGSTGTLAVSSNLVATTNQPLTFTSTAGSTIANASGTLQSVASLSDALSGSISIQVGNGASQTITLGPSNGTLSGLASAINSAGAGVTASIVSNSDGSSSLNLVSNTAGTDGNLTVTSNIVDAANAQNTQVNYTNSSDIGALTALGVSVNNDGSIQLDATSLDSLINSDYSGLVGFFQSANSWGQSFSTILNNAGSSSSSGVLSLAKNSNSSIESTLNADISREQSLISAQQSSLTKELNSANEIMQQLPTQLQGVNELYSAISGYNQNGNG